jgi:hypothetical protein
LFAQASSRLTSVKAKYTLYIPSDAKQVAVAAHHYLSYGPLATSVTTVHHGTPFDTLDVVAEDMPEIDSHIKQLGVFIGEVANAQSIHVTKQTGKALHDWDLANPFYTPPTASPMMQPQGPQALGAPDFATQNASTF